MPASFWVNPGNHENTDLGPDVRFPTRTDAEQAAAWASDFIGNRADFQIEESDKPANVTLSGWNTW